LGRSDFVGARDGRSGRHFGSLHALQHPANDKRMVLSVISCYDGGLN
jgi:hypothetical protein